MFFASTNANFDDKQLISRVYHPQSNGQGGQYSRTIATRLVPYNAGHQRSWDSFVQPLTYANNSQIHHSTNTSPYSSVLIVHALGPSLHRDSMENLKVNDTGTLPQMMRKLIQVLIHVLQTNVKRHMHNLQACNKYDYNCRVCKTPIVTKGSYIHIYKPPIRATPETTIKAIEKKEYKKSNHGTLDCSA